MYGNWQVKMFGGEEKSIQSALPELSYYLSASSDIAYYNSNSASNEHCFLFLLITFYLGLWTYKNYSWAMILCGRHVQYK